MHPKATPNSPACKVTPDHTLKNFRCKPMHCMVQRLNSSSDSLPQPAHPGCVPSASASSPCSLAAHCCSRSAPPQHTTPHPAAAAVAACQGCLCLRQHGQTASEVTSKPQQGGFWSSTSGPCRSLTEGQKYKCKHTQLLPLSSSQGQHYSRRRNAVCACCAL